MLDAPGKALLNSWADEFQTRADRAEAKNAELTASVADLAAKIPVYRDAADALGTAAVGIVDLQVKALVLAEAARLDDAAEEMEDSLERQKPLLADQVDRLEAMNIAIDLLRGAAA